jgi:hypothetical protein
MASPQEKVCMLWYWVLKSVIKVQRHRLEYGGKSMKCWSKRFKDVINVLHKKGAGRPSVDADTVSGAHETFERSPGKSIPRAASMELHIRRTTVQQILICRVHAQTEWQRQPSVSGTTAFQCESTFRVFGMVNRGPTQPPVRWVSGALSLGAKRPGRAADHWPPSSA